MQIKWAYENSIIQKKYTPRYLCLKQPVWSCELDNQRIQNMLVHVLHINNLDY